MCYTINSNLTGNVFPRSNWERTLLCKHFKKIREEERKINMKEKTIEKAVKVINREMRTYQRQLSYQLELKAEAEFHNGYLEDVSYGDYESNIKQYEIILAELATIKRAIRNNETSVKSYGAFCSRDDVYTQTSEVLKKAGFDIQSDGFGKYELFSIEEFEEECEKELKEFEECSEIYDDGCPEMYDEGSECAQEYDEMMKVYC